MKRKLDAIIDRCGMPCTIVSDNGRFRDECLNERLFTSLPQARDQMRRTEGGLQQRKMTLITGQYHTQRICRENGIAKTGCIRPKQTNDFSKYLEES
jgi:hypothetical protein